MTILERPIRRFDAEFRTRRDPVELISRITLSNGAEVELVGFVGSISYPPDYLEDLRAGRL